MISITTRMMCAIVCACTSVSMALAHPNKVVPAGEGEAVENPFHPVSLLMSKKDSEGALTVYEFIIPPKSPGSPPHTHSLEDEYFFVVEGALSVLSGEEVLVLNTGDFAALNRGIPHMFWNDGEEAVKLIMATTGGTFEEFMTAVAPSLAEARPQDAMEAGAVVGALAAEHGITISMEKMPEVAAQYYAP